MGLFFVVGLAGPPATRSREPGQARKGAAAAVVVCAEVWLAGTASRLPDFDQKNPAKRAALPRTYFCCVTPSEDELPGSLCSMLRIETSARSMNGCFGRGITLARPERIS